MKEDAGLNSKYHYIKWSWRNSIHWMVVKFFWLNNLLKCLPGTMLMLKRDSGGYNYLKKMREWISKETCISKGSSGTYPFFAGKWLTSSLLHQERHGEDFIKNPVCENLHNIDDNSSFMYIAIKCTNICLLKRHTLVYHWGFSYRQGTKIYHHTVKCDEHLQPCCKQ